MKDPEISDQKNEKISPKNARNMIVSAMRAIDADADWVSLSALGNQLNASYPDFDPRNYGCRNLSTLVRQAGKLDVSSDNPLRVRQVA